MKKKVKEAYKTVAKYEKREAEKAALMDFRKFRPAGCHKCHNGQIISGGGDYCSVTYYERCKCANKKTDRYSKYLKDVSSLMESMSAREFNELESKWYDNNSDISEGNNSVDRSW